MNKRDVVVNKLVRSISKRTVAKIVSVDRSDPEKTRVILDFGWDTPNSRCWPTTVSHVAKYYMDL